ncbi:hypothetical protein ES707_16701 [subsurface metagenome]
MGCAMLWVINGPMNARKYRTRLLRVVAGGIVLLAFLLGLAAAKKPELGEHAVSMLRRHANTIITIARKVDIQPVAIAGVIAAELTLNHNRIDYAQDLWLKTRLKLYDDGWWEAWALEMEQLATESRDVRLISNKWPISLVWSGYVMSFGPAQITPRTALLACKEFKDRPDVCEGSVKQIVSRLLREETAIKLVAVILSVEAKQWAKCSEHNARADLGLLATLYSMGGDYYRHRFGKSNPGIVYNYFGRWVSENGSRISKLLENEMR